MLIAEFPLVQPNLYHAQIPPVIYLSGVLMFVAGLAVVRVHNVWARNWTALITLSGWFILALGLVRMFAASQYQHATQGASPLTFMVLEACLLVVALTITFKSYSGNTT
jgi:multisubunit Na+/H+ antiporter MnhG subunit